MRAVLFALALLFSTTALAQSLSVVDGDTIRRDGQLIRIVGIDTPELRGRCQVERDRALDAKRRLQSFVNDGVTIEIVLNRAGEPRRDRYGRFLGIVRDRHGRDVAEMMIREGWGRAYDPRSSRQGWC